MRYQVHRDTERGVAEHGWLSSRFSFSFADWYEPNRMGFGALRVINDDTIAPTSGFGMHPHRDMEIITVVTEGTLAHKDSAGNTGTVPAGGVQVMSAGTGVVHSEYNDANTPLKLFQIWILPKALGIEPYYAEHTFDFESMPSGILTFVAPGDGSEGNMLGINQDAWISHAVIDPEHPAAYELKKAGNGAYIFVIDGQLLVEGEELRARDAIGIEDTSQVNIQALSPSRVFIFDVPMR